MIVQKEKSALFCLFLLATLVFSISLLDSTNYAFAASGISSAVADDPDDGDTVYSVGDTIVITFPAQVNSTFASGTMTNAEFRANFTVSTTDIDTLDTVTGAWNAGATQLTLTINTIGGVDPPTINTDTVLYDPTLGNIHYQLNGTEFANSDVTLTGDFGLFVQATVNSNKGGGCSGDCEEPTLGVDYRGTRLVEDGFSYNGKSIDVERYFTPYPLVTVQTGKQNVAEFKIYDNMDPDSISHFELAFGLASGQSIGMSKAVINWDKSWDGVETVTLDDPENVLDNIKITTSEGSCSEALQSECLIVKVVHTFRAPLDFNMLGTNVWDAKRNAWQNYYNHGIEVVGESLNPPKEMLVASADRDHRGLVHITQIDSLNQIWITDDGYKYQMNDFGSFVLTDSPKKIKTNVGNPDNRNHSAFELLKKHEAIRASYHWNADDYTSELIPAYSYEFPTEDSRTKFLKEHNMLAWSKGQ